MSVRRFGPVGLRRAGFRGTGGGAGAFDPADVFDVRYFRNADMSVSAWTDQALGVDLANPTTATQPDLTDPDASFGGQPTLDFVAANNDALAETAVDSALNCLHNGLGGTLAMYLEPSGAGTTETIYSTMSTFTSSNHGIVLRHVATTGQLRVAVATGSGFAFDDTSAASSFVSGDKGILIVRVGSGASPEYDISWKGSSIGSGSFGTAPSTSDHSAGATLARAATQYGDLKIAALAVASRYITDSEVVSVRDAWINTWGAESP